MKFQVILPTFNASRWFGDAVRSVSAQPNSEVLVIDDGSRKDECEKIEEICKNFSNVRFVPRTHEGLVGALNHGLAIATAPYVARMDADDITMPHRFELQLAYLDAHPEVAVVGGQMIGIDEAGTLNGLKTHLPVSSFNMKALLQRGKSPFVHPSVMMRREAILSVGAYRVAAEYSEDYDLWHRVSEQYEIANLSEAILYYRRHRGQVTRSINWRQKFAHDLGTIAAERRRAGKPDPLDTIRTCIDVDRPEIIADDEIRGLMKAYRVLLGKHDNLYLTAEDYGFIYNALDGLRFGASSKSRSKAAAGIARSAFSSRNYRAFRHLVFKSIAINPMLAISSFLKPNS